MKKTIIKLFVPSVLLFLGLYSSAFADPLAIGSIVGGDEVKISRGDYGRASGGGEFKIDMVNRGESPYDYISFCLEIEEHIQYNTIFYADAVNPTSDSAYAGGGGAVGGADLVSDETKWWFWNYLTDGFEGVDEKSDSVANSIQRIIWDLEGEINIISDIADNVIDNPANLDSAADVFYWAHIGEAYDNGLFNSSAVADFSISGNVKVLNLRTGVGGTGGTAQSQLIAEAPEPAAMLLFGTGLASLAGVARRRKSQK